MDSFSQLKICSVNSLSARGSKKMSHWYSSHLFVYVSEMSVCLLLFRVPFVCGFPQILPRKHVRYNLRFSSATLHFTSLNSIFGGFWNSFIMDPFKSVQT